MKTYENLNLKTEVFKMSQGTYQAKLIDNTLYFSNQMDSLFNQYQLNTVLSMLSWLFCYPSAVAQYLNWDVKDVLKANDELKILLDWEGKSQIFHQLVLVLKNLNNCQFTNLSIKFLNFS